MLLVHGGVKDVVAPNWDLGGRRDVLRREYASSGHLPFYDDRAVFLTDLLDFYDRVEGQTTPRSGLYDGRG